MISSREYDKCIISARSGGNLLKYIEIYESAIYYNNTPSQPLFVGSNQKQNNRVGRTAATILSDSSFFI